MKCTITRPFHPFSLGGDPLDVGVHGGDAVRTLDRQSDEALVAPLGAPGVLDQPVRRGTGRLVRDLVAAVVTGRKVEGRTTAKLCQFFSSARHITFPVHFCVTFKIDTNQGDCMVNRGTRTLVLRRQNPTLVEPPAVIASANRQGQRAIFKPLDYL